MKSVLRTDIEKNMGLVHIVAQRMRHLSRGLMSYEDLISEGVIGLIKALERFDPKRGFKFSSFAVSYIRGFMLQGHRNLHLEFWKAKDSRYEIPSTTISIYRSTPGQAPDQELAYIPGLHDRGAGSASSISSAHNAMIWERVLPLLTKRQREVVLLMLAGVPQKEIAPKFGVSRQAVSQAYQKAIKTAKTYFAANGRLPDVG